MEDSGPSSDGMMHDTEEILNIENNARKIDQHHKKTDTRKKTFGNIDMTARIQKFNQLTAGNECVFGSGSCATHNCKLVRSVQKKRMSVQNKDGEISWTMRDVTCLKCPSNNQTKLFTGVNSVSTDESELDENHQGTNKKPRMTGSEINEPITAREDQSHGE